ncbi:TonB-dependent receptor [Niabella sp. W65]|nr:TonB-dependent receptor [Niabella sp. W65]MCH7363080.1 TonB-dependent receptor [Niabella sp. W65]ULT39011.1 TonB-dependent receptor [Niabella sp. I65]
MLVLTFLFKERLSITVDFYRHNTKEMLVYNKGNSVSGIAYYLYNNGAMVNTGIDLNIFGRITNGRVKWDAGITLGKYKNEITAIPETVFTEFAGGTYITQVGAAANSFLDINLKEYIVHRPKPMLRALAYAI